MCSDGNIYSLVPNYEVPIGSLVTDVSFNGLGDPSLVPSLKGTVEARKLRMSQNVLKPINGFVKETPKAGEDATSFVDLPQHK